MDDFRVWLCATHFSTINETLIRDGATPPSEMWGACHYSLWTFAAGQGVDGEGNPTIGRCVIKRYRLEEM